MYCLVPLDSNKLNTCLLPFLILMYKCVNKLAPNYLCNMFTPRALSFDLRDASQKLYLPKLRTDHLKRIGYSGASLWNDLPEDIRTAKSLRNLKRRIDKWLSLSDSVPHGKYVNQLIENFT